MENLKNDDRFILPVGKDGNTVSSYHLFLLRLKNFSEEERNILIKFMADRGIPFNVHYKPLPLFSAYKELGYHIDDYPNAYNQYQNVVTLPLHTLLTVEDIDHICDALLNF